MTSLLKLHPKGLFWLCITVAFQRFGMYGFKTLLFLYLVNGLAFSDFAAGKIFGVFSAIYYALPLLGGLLADRLLGYNRSILIGAVITWLGLLFLIPQNSDAVLVGLSLIAIGGGLFEPNLNSLVGKLYLHEHASHLKDSGYTLYFTSVNIGALFAIVICGAVGQKMGWHYGFGIAAAAVLISALAFYLGTKDIGHHASARSLEKGGRVPLTLKEKNHIKVIVIVTLITAVFVSAFEQGWSSLLLFAERYTDRSVLGFEIPSTVFPALISVFVVILGPVYASLFSRLARMGREPGAMTKLAGGLILIGVCFLILTWSALPQAGSPVLLPNSVSPGWLILAFFVCTAGELLVYPIGLSLVSRLAPRQYSALMMGVWTFSVAIGSYFAGILGGLMESVGSISHFFLISVTFCFVAATLVKLSIPRINRLMN